jgi:hypothetical protein
VVPRIPAADQEAAAEDNPKNHQGDGPHH